MPPSGDSTLTVIFDIDGTLVDTNYQHAIAWHRAFFEHDYRVQLWEIHRHIGMGGDQLVSALIGEEGERADGDGLREVEGKVYEDLIEEVQAMDGASELLRELGEDGATLVLSSSAKADEVERYLDLLDARDLVAGWTTEADVDATKPDPELIEVALEKGGGGRAVMVGDSIWDIEAAKKVDVPTLAVLTGGFSEADLRDAGAAAVVESIGKLREDRDQIGALLG